MIARAAALAALVLLAPSAGAEPRPGGVAAPAKPAARSQPGIVAVTSTGAGQAGYVHYFLIAGPDGEGEIQVGVELEDQRIAWSFPGLGAVISPFVAEGVVAAPDGTEVGVWHLYGLRPFAGDRAMAALLAARIRPWIAARTPHCENEPRGGGCVSCLGFVLRALYPARADGYPALPRDWPAGPAGNYTTRELLLYLTGVAQLPTREARLARVARQPLPADLRDDLEHLIHAGAAFDAASSPAAAPAPKSGMRTRPARKL